MTKGPKDIWDKMHASATLIASVFVPLAVAFVGSSYTNAMKEAENKLRYVELAIGVLRAEPSRETDALRGWAVEVLSSQSVVPLSDGAKAQLKASPLTFKFLSPYSPRADLSPEAAEFFERAASVARPSASDQ
jgi:hypothetical protein